MRGRPCKKRRISFYPETTYFKPAGIPLQQMQEEILGLDEVEAIRLADLEDMTQEQAAEKMEISRITFLRIIDAAHKKVAKSLIYGKAIKMEGGDVIMPNLDGTGPNGAGPMSGRGAGQGRRMGLGGTVECVCPDCGEKVAHTRGTPCVQTKCPKCGARMTGKYCPTE
jgi:hypothetical protein